MGSCQWRFFITMECDHLEKGKGKRRIFRFFIFLDRRFRSLTLRRNHLHSFQVKARLYINFIALRKYNFLDYFLFCFMYKIFAVTIRNITPYTERTFQSQMLTSLRKSSSVSCFSIRPASGLHSAQSSFIFHLNAF